MGQAGTDRKVRRTLTATRMDDGSVLLTVTAFSESAPETPDAVTTLVLRSEEWCRAVASVSPLGATPENIRSATALHGIAA